MFVVMVCNRIKQSIQKQLPYHHYQTFFTIKCQTSGRFFITFSLYFFYLKFGLLHFNYYQLGVCQSLVLIRTPFDVVSSEKVIAAYNNIKKLWFLHPYHQIILQKVYPSMGYFFYCVQM